MRDKFSGEAAGLFKPLGFYKKFTDAGYRDASKKLMEAQADVGLADSILLPIQNGHSLTPVFIEHKTGEGTCRERFSFDRWVEKQRDFHNYCLESGFHYLLFLVMGDHIGARRFPRTAFLLRGQQMMDIEVMAQPRKSLSYDTAVRLLEQERLVWQRGRWSIPENHPFWSLIKWSATPTSLLEQLDAVKSPVSE